MIDSGVTGNFMIRKYTENRKHLIRDKKQLYGLINFDNILLKNDSE